MREDGTLKGCFCKYLLAWQYEACHVGFGCLRVAFGISDEILRVILFLDTLQCWFLMQDTPQFYLCCWTLFKYTYLLQDILDNIIVIF